MIGTAGLAPLLRAFAGLRRLRGLTAEQRAIVVYAEQAHDWSYLGPIVNTLLTDHGLPVTYVTSDLNDPRLADSRPGLSAVYVGTGTARTAFFLGLQARVALMTMPDLQSFHLKRSRVAGVHYVYLFHALVSTHMIYRRGAFDHYDTILCAGPHHEREIRARERQLGLAAKNLIACGYPRLDALRGQCATRPAAPPHPRRALLAPSWGPHGTLETIGQRVVQVMLDAGYDLTVRPHPMTLRRSPTVVSALRDRFASCPRFSLDLDIHDTTALATADVLISDWSGVAFEYAFARHRPVVFLDVPRKINNPAYTDLLHCPVEVGLRDTLGLVVDPADLAGLPGACERCVRTAREWSMRIAAVHAAYVYHPGRSARVAAAQIATLADRAPTGAANAPPRTRETVVATSAKHPIDTQAILAELSADRRTFDRPTLTHLAALCKRLSLDRNLDANYADQWRRVAGSPPLSTDGWQMLLDLLLDDDRLDSNDRHLIRWKFVNAALAALDVLSKHGDPARWTRQRRRATAALTQLAAGSPS